MPFEYFRILHICGLLLLFMGLAAMWGLHAAGGEVPRKRRMAISIIHGIGLLLLLISGMAMASSLNIVAHPPVWLDIKVVIWLLMGASLMAARRRAKLGSLLIWVWVAFGTLAAYLAILKPG